MINLIITMVDAKEYHKSFSTSQMRDLFLAKLELFEGLFIDISEGDQLLRINPKYIVRVEEAKTSSIEQ